MKLFNPLRQLTPKVAVLCIAQFFNPLMLSGAQQHDTSQCTIDILSPKQGEHVAEAGTVKGKAHIPEGKDLWVFVHVKGLALWWPQGAGPAALEEGKWEVLATFGIERDAGRDFEIAVAVLEPTETKELLQWFKKGDETGRYSGMRFPPVVRGCPIPHVIVTKLR
jgi:hypothetical protein